MFAARRDRAPKDKQSVPRAEFVAHDRRDVARRSRTACSRARRRSAPSTRAAIDSRDEFYAFFASPREAEDAPTPIHAGFALTHFSGDVELEKKIKDDLVRHRALHPAREERARHVPVHGQAERAARRLGQGVLSG